MFKKEAAGEPGRLYAINNLEVQMIFGEIH